MKKLPIAAKERCPRGHPEELVGDTSLCAMNGDKTGTAEVQCLILF
jgi:hypothetical protein